MGAVRVRDLTSDLGFLEPKDSEFDIEEHHEDTFKKDSQHHGCGTSKRVPSYRQLQRGCVFRPSPSPHVPDESLLRVINSEIRQHNEEVEKAKTDRVRPTSGLLGSKISLSNRSLRSRDSAESYPLPVYEYVHIGRKASSIDMEIKKNLIKPPPDQQNELFLFKRKRQQKQRLSQIERNVKSCDDLLKLNPFKRSKKVNFFELREMLSTSNSESPNNIDNKEQRDQYTALRDARLQGPLYRVNFTEHMGSDIKEIQQEKKNQALEHDKLFQLRDSNQIMAVTRKHRKMRRETKFDLLERFREMNRCTMDLAIRRRMINFLDSSVKKFETDIACVEEETEQLARTFHDILHESDRKTSEGINKARQVREELEEITKTKTQLEKEISRLNCVNLEIEDDLSVRRRFFNLMRAIVPDFNSLYQEDIDINFDLPLTSCAHEQATDSDDHVIAKVVEAIESFSQESEKACHLIAEAKTRNKEAHVAVEGDILAARSHLESLQSAVTNKQLEVDKLRSEVQALSQQRAAIADDSPNREVFRRPIINLELKLKTIVHKYIRDLQNRYPRVEDLLANIREKLRQHRLAFGRFSPPVVKKWFDIVDVRRAENEKIDKIIAKQAKRDKRLVERREKALATGVPARVMVPKFRSNVAKKPKKDAGPRDVLVVMAEEVEAAKLRKPAERVIKTANPPVNNMELPLPIMLPSADGLRSMASVNVAAIASGFVSVKGSESEEDTAAEHTEPCVCDNESPCITGTVLTEYQVLPEESTEAQLEIVQEEDTFCISAPYPDWDPADLEMVLERLSMKEHESKEALDEEAKKKRQEFMENFFGALKMDRLERGLVKSTESLPKVTENVPQTVQPVPSSTVLETGTVTSELGRTTPRSTGRKTPKSPDLNKRTNPT